MYTGDYFESMPLHQQSTSISFWTHSGLTSNSCRCHKNHFVGRHSIACRNNYDVIWLTSNSLGCQPHLAISLQFHSGFASNSLRMRLHFDFTAMSLRFRFETIAIPLRILVNAANHKWLPHPSVPWLKMMMVLLAPTIALLMSLSLFLVQTSVMILTMGPNS